MPSVGWLTKDNMWLNLIIRRSHVKDEILKFSAWSSPKTWHWAKGKKRKSSMTSGTALSWPFSTSIVAMATNSWVPSSLLTYPGLQIPQQSQERHNRDFIAPPQRVCWHAVSLHGTGAVLRGAGFSRSSTQLRRLSGFHSPPFYLSRPRNILKESSHPGSHLFDRTIKWPLWASTGQQWEGKTPNEQYLKLLEYSV